MEKECGRVSRRSVVLGCIRKRVVFKKKVVFEKEGWFKKKVVYVKDSDSSTTDTWNVDLDSTMFLVDCSA